MIKISALSSILKKEVIPFSSYDRTQDNFAEFRDINIFCQLKKNVGIDTHKLSFILLVEEYLCVSLYVCRRQCDMEYVCSCAGQWESTNLTCSLNDLIYVPLT